MCSHSFLEGSLKRITSIQRNRDTDFKLDFKIVQLNNRFFLKKEVKSEWWFWRPIIEGVLSYTEASEMHPYELALVNAGIDYKIEEENKKIKNARPD